MALRDKDGKPIISQENIEHFPKYSKLASAVKTYAEPKKTMTKALEENGNVGKGPAARKKSAEAKKKQPLQKATGVEL